MRIWLLYGHYVRPFHPSYHSYYIVPIIPHYAWLLLLFHIAIKDRKFSVQSSFKLKLPPPLIVEASTLKLVESVGEGIELTYTR